MSSSNGNNQGNQPALEEDGSNSKRPALAGQWRTPPLPVFPTTSNGATTAENGAATGAPGPAPAGGAPPSTEAGGAGNAAAPSGAPAGSAAAGMYHQPHQHQAQPRQPQPLQSPSLPDNSEEYAKALQEAYRRGAAAATAMHQHHQPQAHPHSQHAHHHQAQAHHHQAQAHHHQTQQQAHAQPQHQAQQPLPPSTHQHQQHPQQHLPSTASCPNFPVVGGHHGRSMLQPSRSEDMGMTYTSPILPITSNGPPPSTTNAASAPTMSVSNPHHHHHHAANAAPAVPNPLGTSMPPPPTRQPHASKPATTTTAAAHAHHPPTAQAPPGHHPGHPHPVHPHHHRTGAPQQQPIHNKPITASTPARPGAATAQPGVPPATQHQQQRSVSLPDMTSYAVMAEEEKRQKRLARNRASARLRRLRKKNLVDAYETEVGILEKTLQQLRAHEWGIERNDDHSSLLEALSMDRGQQAISSEQRAQQCLDILQQQLEQLDMLKQMQLEHQILYAAATTDEKDQQQGNQQEVIDLARELQQVLQLSPDQCRQLRDASHGLQDEATALDTVYDSLVTMKENEWLVNQGVQDITDQLTGILHKNQMSKFLLWADANVEAIDQLDHIHAHNSSQPQVSGPIFTFGVETTPVDDDEK